MRAHRHKLPRSRIDESLHRLVVSTIRLTGASYFLSQLTENPKIGVLTKRRVNRIRPTCCEVAIMAKVTGLEAAAVRGRAEKTKPVLEAQLQSIAQSPVTGRNRNNSRGR